MPIDRRDFRRPLPIIPEIIFIMLVAWVVEATAEYGSLPPLYEVSTRPGDVYAQIEQIDRSTPRSSATRTAAKTTNRIVHPPPIAPVTCLKAMHKGGFMSAQNSPANTASHAECKTRLENFIAELDAILTENPNSLEPLLTLLEKHFPLKNCDVMDAISITSQSRYFTSVEEQPRMYVFSFSNASSTSRSSSGFDVIFGLSKVSGDSQLPFALVHK